MEILDVDAGSHNNELQRQRKGTNCRCSDTELSRKKERTRNLVKVTNMIHSLRGFSSNALFLHCMQLLSVEGSCKGCRVGGKS